ncbi:hypothetical protein FOZ62_011309, partial [Perkinsus olseni]
YKPIWEDRRERSREAVNTKATKYPSQEVKIGDYVLIYKPKKHKLDVCWAGPYKVIDRCGVKVTLKVGQTELVDSIDHVLKVELGSSFPKRIRTVIPQGCLVLYGDNEIGLVRDGKGCDHVLHHGYLTQHYKDAYEVFLYYWKPVDGSVRSVSLRSSGSFETSGALDEGYVPLLKSQSFSYKLKNWTILNVSTNGYLTKRAVAQLSSITSKLVEAYKDKEQRTPEVALCALVVEEIQDFQECKNGETRNCSSTVEVEDEFNRSLLRLVPTLVLSMSTPSNKEVRDLFDRMTALSNKHGWLDLIDHYSTQCRDEKVVNFIRSFFAERRGWSNTAMIDPYAFSKVRTDESCLPMAVTQLRAQGLDGSKESSKV